ncbi:MAG: hypothetical protein KF770_10700 [Anaerolineae bacterium]|nr:hypothetical protein [Anaerolineae bacterium]
MFSLSDLTPDREPFDLGDGRLVYFRNKADFDLQELAAWERLLKAMEQVVSMRKKATNEQQYAYAANKSSTAARELIGLVLPELPADVRDRLTEGQIDQLATMCILVASGQMRGAGATEAQLLAIAEKHPDLPAEFIASLNRAQANRLLNGEVEDTAVPEKKATDRQKAN